MIWFFAPLAFSAGAGGAWWITKETAKEVVEAGQGDNPKVVMGSNYSVDGMTVLVVIIALVAWYFWHKKGKG